MQLSFQYGHSNVLVPLDCSIGAPAGCWSRGYCPIRGILVHYNHGGTFGETLLSGEPVASSRSARVSG
eukprot:scaffold26650_cov15-Tisochrysis_lutea.AAC.1